MTEPAADDRQVVAGTEQMYGSGMAESVCANLLRRERGQVAGGMAHMTLNDSQNAETSEWFAAHAEE